MTLHRSEENVLPLPFTSRLSPHVGPLEMGGSITAHSINWDAVAILGGGGA